MRVLCGVLVLAVLVCSACASMLCAVCLGRAVVSLSMNDAAITFTARVCGFYAAFSWLKPRFVIKVRVSGCVEEALCVFVKASRLVDNSLKLLDISPLFAKSAAAARRA